jgi:hypothetical protein
MRRSTRLASVVLTEPQLFQFESTAGVGVSDGVGGKGGGAEGGGAAGIVFVPRVDNPFEPSPDSIIDSLSDTVNDMLGLDVSQCYSPEAELLQHLSQQHLVLAELSYLMDSAGAPKYLLDCIISRLRFASTDMGFDLLSGSLPTCNTLMERLQSIVSVPAQVSVPVALETGQMTTVMTNCAPSLFLRHLLSDTYSDLSNLDLPDPASPFSSKPSVDPPRSTSIIDFRWYHLTYKIPPVVARQWV